MKVLMLNGSCNERGCTYTAQEEIGRTLREEGVDCEIFQLGADPVRDCIGCGQCTPHCPQSIDIPQELHRIDDFVERLKQGTL